MKKKYFLQCLSFMLTYQITIAQSLHQGEKCPDLKFTELFNSKANELQLSSLKGKIVIFDFWGINCITCIQAFPKLDSLQKRFQDKIQIIAVSKESKKTIANFFEKRRQIKIPAFPFLCSDTILSQLFPHSGKPVYAWLDDQQQFRFLTEGFSVNEETIAALTSHEKPIVPNFQSGHQKIKNVIDEQHHQKIELLSYISRCILGYQEPYNDSLRKRSAGLYMTCASVTELYIKAFSEGRRYNFKRMGRVHTDFTTDEKYLRPPKNSAYGKWRAEYSYNYELVVPISMKEQCYKIMQADLQRYFDLHVEIKTVPTYCLVLEKTADTNLLKTNGRAPFNTFLRSSEYGTKHEQIRELTNLPFEYFSGNLGAWLERERRIPFVDLTGIKYNIDIALSKDAVETLSLNILNEELKKYGLYLTEREIPLECLFLSN